MCTTLALAAVATVLAAPVNIKLATAVPANSTWHKALLDMGDAWVKATESRVKLTVYAGGTQGDAAATVRMMRPGVDQLQAGLLMAVDLATIDEAFNVFGIPFFFESDDEELAVERKLTPIIEQRLSTKGFHLLSWGNGGWVQLFSKKPIKTLDDLKKARLFTSQGEDKLVQWYKSNGFNPVALSQNEIPAQMKLATGMIDAAPMPPYPALMLNVYRDAKYALDLRVAPLIGAAVITNEAWSKISADDRKKMLDAAQAFEKRLNTDAPKQDADSLKAMIERGLVVTTLDPKAVAEFRAAAEKLVITMRGGGMVPGDIYDIAVQERDAYRKSKGR
jgi:TRAP-type C4-dicarboxylate transport system substrate-binding protein